MINDIFTGITSTLQTKVPELNQIALFNNQFENIGLNNDFEKVSETIFFPCAFIEFGETEYENRSVTTQFGTANITLHVAVETLDSNDTSILFLKQKVNSCIHGLSTPFFNKLVRTSEQTDNDHKNVYIYRINYQTTFIDDTTYLYKDNPDSSITGLTFNIQIEE